MHRRPRGRAQRVARSAGGSCGVDGHEVAPPSPSGVPGAGPTPGDGADPVAWSEDVCTALSTWSSELSAEAATATAALDSAESVEEAATGLEDLLGAATGSTEELIELLEEAGDPAVGAGAEIGGEVRGAAEDARAALEELTEVAEAAATEDPEDFARVVNEIVDGYATATAAVGRRIGEASDRYPAPELDAAGAAAASCAEPAPSEPS